MKKITITPDKIKDVSMNSAFYEMGTHTIHLHHTTHINEKEVLISGLAVNLKKPTRPVGEHGGKFQAMPIFGGIGNGRVSWQVEVMCYVGEKIPDNIQLRKVFKVNYSDESLKKKLITYMEDILTLVYTGIKMDCLDDIDTLLYHRARK